MAKRKKQPKSRQWRLMDLHLHTPASSDYQEPDISCLDILYRSEARNLDIIAFTDHNTVAGYRKMQEEIQQLEFLERSGRITEEEGTRLSEYRRLLKKILVLPGFEFTATLGFHILGVFPPETPVREIEHLLLSLNIPADQLDNGSMTVGATSDVLTAYRLIDEAGGLAIAAHANSTHGVAMRGFGFGGQTKIAYTQDPHLHALEVTDLGQKGRRSTAKFFNGTKPEYPRRMHCIQGSDAHRLRTDPKDKKQLGVGDRATWVNLPVFSFDALRELFLSNDFARTRPHWPASDEEYDFIQQAREEGPSIIQDFHESMTVRGGRLYAIIADACAFANTNGGTLYVGISSDPKKAPAGVSKPSVSIRRLREELSKRISPPLACQVDGQETQGKKVIRILVPDGEDPPYAVDDNKIYVRDEADTGLAVRDEIVQLVVRGSPSVVSQQEVEPAAEEGVEITEVGLQPPRTGVEIVGFEKRNGVSYYTMRDLRNGNVVKNVTRSSARRLWHYAISQYTALPKNLKGAQVTWLGDIGVLRVQRRGAKKRYDLVQRSPGGIRYYFGVTEDGIHGEWKVLVGGEAE
ncbi:MAG: putative DNA binding domain-containing protein [Anaerolineaceae bacterium]|nr:MAG: putative DNA binding domain-containing protein [Anaerolineaceae bacterium]